MRLNCPRCGYTIIPRTQWLTVEYCPRCLARDRRAVQLQEPERPASGDGDASAASADERDTTPSARWISAFNMRDLAGMLACLDRDVHFHPLKLHGVADGGYRGHEGVERWFAEITALGHDHRIVVSEFRALPAGVILTIGRLSFGDVSAGTPVCGVHEVAGGLIVTAQHYMSDPDTLERLGLLGRQQKQGNSGSLRISETGANHAKWRGPNNRPATVPRHRGRQARDSARDLRAARDPAARLDHLNSVFGGPLRDRRLSESDESGS